MARKGENIRKRKDGRWEGRYAVLTKDGRRYHSVYASTYAEIRVKLASARDAAKSGQQLLVLAKTSAARAGNSFEASALEWLQYIRGNRKYSTYIKYRELYNKYLTELDYVQMEELTNNIIRFKLTLLNARESDILKDSVYRVLNQIIKYGNKTHGYEVEEFVWNRKAIRKKNTEIFNHTEQRKLLGILYKETDAFKKGILLCLSTGLRLGEICSLKWSDIDFNMKILHVNSTIQRIYMNGFDTKTALFESVPKSENSLREIPLSDGMVELLQSIPCCGDYVVKGTRPVEPRTYENKLKAYLDQAKIAPRNFHALRHTFATNCIESGMDVKSLSEILGHADVRITLNRYVHPTIETKRNHMNRLSSIYGQIYGQSI